MLVAAFSIERAVTTTVAPADANRWAIARPIPRLAPVTSAALPLRDGVSTMINSPEASVNEKNAIAPFRYSYNDRNNDARAFGEPQKGTGE
jgi:hypothetical protein